MASELTLSRIPAEPVIWTWTPGSEEALGAAEYGWRDARLTVRRLRGRKMLDEAALFDEFAAALQFPGYFGENWPALNDCLTDMGWLPPEAGYVLVITEPLQVLERAHSTALSTLVRNLRAACMEWAAPIELGEWWDRPGVPFHVILVSEPANEGDVATRWHAAGANLSALP